MTTITQAHLKSLLTYDPDTGEFRWKVQRSNRAPIGSIAGCSDKYGYIVVRVDGTLYKAHRLAWLYMYGEWPDGQIDHINGIRTDNRIGNLRVLPQRHNAENRRWPSKNNKSGFLGVRTMSHGYVAVITINGKGHNLGYFKKPEEAHQAYLKAKRELHEGGVL
jgi:hypothetical protein